VHKNTFGLFGRGRLHRTGSVRRDRRQFGRPRSGIMTRQCCICGEGMAQCRRRASLQREPLIVGAFAASGARDLQGRPRPDAVRERCSQRVEQRLSGFFLKKSQWRIHIEKKREKFEKVGHRAMLYRLAGTAQWRSLRHGFRHREGKHWPAPTWGPWPWCCGKKKFGVE
jgi:hypothetical protein